MNDSPNLEFWKILTPIWDDLKLFDANPDVYLRRFSELTHPQRILFPTLLVVSDIQNGGFHQYFWNTTGMYVPEAASGFESLGLHETQTVVQAEMAIFGNPFPRDREKRIKFLDSHAADEREDWNPFYELDEDFYDSIAPESGYAIGRENRFEAAINAYARRVNN